MVANVVVVLGLALGVTGGPLPRGVPTSPTTATPPRPGDAARPDEDPASAAAKTTAQATLAEGNRRLKDGDVAGAIAEYRQAQTIYPPAAGKIEFNIAKAEETRGDEPAAAAAFERFLSQALEIPPEYRDEARNELRRLSAALGALRLAERRPGYDVLVDGRDHGKTPLDGDVWVRPGHHVITLEQDNRVLFRDDVDVESGATVQITVTIHHPEAVASPARTAPPALALTNPGAAAESRTPPPLVMAPPGPGAPAARADGPSDEISRPLWKRWWFWAVAGAVVAGGATTYLVLSNRDNCPSGYSCKQVAIPAGQ